MPYSIARIFKYSCSAFIIGIAGGSWFFLPARYYIWIFVLACLFFIIFFILGQNKKISYFFLLLGFVLIGLWRHEISQIQKTQFHVSYYNGQSVELTGIIAREVDSREKNTKLTVEALSLNNVRITGLVLLTTDNYPQYNYGDMIRAKCDLAVPEEFNGFAYDRYLGRYDIYSVCYNPEIKLLDKGRGNLLFAAIYNFKNKIRSVINLGLGEPQAVLVNAIILGDKKGLPVELQTAFSRTGLSHIIAISGMNISILVVMIMGLFLAAGLSRQKAFYFAVIFFAFYILLVGFPASALRAGVMGFLALWAIYLGRINRFDQALVLAAAVMLAFNPKLLRDDIGFQLSFLAMAGLAYFYPLLGRIYENIKFAGAIKILDVVNMTVAAQILSWPVIIYNFKIFSLIAPITNLLVLWTLPLQMSFIMLGISLGLIIPAWSFLYFLPVNILTSFLIFIADIFSHLPRSYLMIEHINIVWLVVYFLAVIVFMIYAKKRGKINNKPASALTGPV